MCLGFITPPPPHRYTPTHRSPSLIITLQVNNEVILSVEYNQEEMTQTLVNNQMEPLLTLTFGQKHGQSLSWRPASSDIYPVNNTYDKDGRIVVS